MLYAHSYRFINIYLGYCRILRLDVRRYRVEQKCACFLLVYPRYRKVPSNKWRVTRLSIRLIWSFQKLHRSYWSGVYIHFARYNSYIFVWWINFFKFPQIVIYLLKIFRVTLKFSQFFHVLWLRIAHLGAQEFLHRIEPNLILRIVSHL